VGFDDGGLPVAISGDRLRGPPTGKMVDWNASSRFRRAICQNFQKRKSAPGLSQKFFLELRERKGAEAQCWPSFQSLAEGGSDAKETAFPFNLIGVEPFKKSL
jgi:hypothetical protein